MPEPSHAFHLPPGVLGCLEWASGTLRINSSPATLALTKRHMAGRTALDGSHPDDGRAADLLRVLTHEQFHFIQVITTGYPYTLACVVFLDVIHQVVSRMAAGSRVAQMLALAETLPPIPRVQQKLDEIDAPGPHGLTIRDVIESAALLYESRALMRAMTHDVYVTYLDTSRAQPEYRKAYDLATYVLGPTAFENHLVASAIALCFRWPHEVFPDALISLRQLAHLDAVYRNPEDLDGLLGIMPALRARGHQYLGATDYIARGDWAGKAPLTHPFYTHALQSTPPLDHNGLFRLVVDPKAMTPDLAATLAQPALFNDDVVQMPAGFQSRHLALAGLPSMQAMNAEDFIDLWMTFAVICHRVLAGTGRALHYRVG